MPLSGPTRSPTRTRLCSFSAQVGSPVVAAADPADPAAAVVHPVHDLRCAATSRAELPGVPEGARAGPRADPGEAALRRVQEVGCMWFLALAFPRVADFTGLTVFSDQ